MQFTPEKCPSCGDKIKFFDGLVHCVYSLEEKNGSLRRTSLEVFIDPSFTHNQCQYRVRCNQHHFWDAELISLDKQSYHKTVHINLPLQTQAR